MRLNNKGFTLVEVLAVVVILTVIGGIAITGVISSINTSKEASYKIMINDIITASQTLYEEINFGNNIYQYDQNGSTKTKITIKNNSISTNLQTLVSNGYLSGEENIEKSGANKNKRIIRNPKTKKDIGTCGIKITWNNSQEIYIVEKADSNNDCPDKYEKVGK